MAAPHMVVRDPARNIINSEQMIQNAFENAHKRDAYNALQQQYGDIAGNPVAAARLQTIDFNRQNNPNVIRHNVLSNQGLAQVNAFNEANNPALIQSNQATADFNTTKAGNAQQQQLSQQHFAVASGALQMLQQQLPKVVDPQMRQAVAANAVRRSAIVNGYNPDLAVKQVQPEIQAIGQHGMAALPVIAQHLQQQRLAALGPEGLAKLRQQQATLASTQALTQARRAKIGANQSAATASRAASTAATDKSNLALSETRRAAMQHAGAIEPIIQRVAQVDTSFAAPDGTVIPSEIDRAIKNVKDTSDNAVIRIGTKEIPGTAAYQLQRNLETIRDQLGLADIQALKQSGVSFGRITNMELQAASRAYGNLDTVGLSKKQLLHTLQRIKHQAIPAFKKSLKTSQAGWTQQAAAIGRVLDKRGFYYGQTTAAAPTGYIQRTGAIESGNNPNATNPNGTAQGLFQITAPTYAGIRQAHPEANLPANQAAATEPQQIAAMKLLTHDNAQALAGANIPVNAVTLRVAHHFGATGATRILRAPATTPAALVVGANTLAVNNLPPTTTTGDLVQMAQKAMAGVAAPQQPAPQMAAPQMAAPQMAAPQMAAPQQAPAQLAQPTPIPQATDAASMNAIYQQLVPQ